MTPNLKVDVIDLLEELSNYMDNKSDVVDGSYGVPEANKEMVLANQIEMMIKRLETTP